MSRLFIPVPEEALDDAALEDYAASADTLPDMTPPILYGRGLGAVQPDETLYLMAHGHALMDMFCANTHAGMVYWTASDMAKLLRRRLQPPHGRQGLQREHQHIEFLVCNAGYSMGKASLLQRRTALKKIQTSRFRLRSTKEQATAELEALLTPRDLQEYHAGEPGGLAKPLCGQVISAMKNHGYPNLFGTAYLGNFHLSRNHGILISGNGNVADARPPDLRDRVTWH